MHPQRLGDHRIEVGELWHLLWGGIVAQFLENLAPDGVVGVDVEEGPRESRRRRLVAGHQ